MATPRKAPWEEEEDEAPLPGFYDQLGLQPEPVNMARTPTPGKARLPTAPGGAAPRAAAPTNPLDYSTLTGGAQQPQPPQRQYAQSSADQRHTAPPLTEHGAAPPPATRVTRQNEAQYGVPTDEAARQRFYAERNQNDPVAGQPGLFWVHDGSGWTVSGTPGTPGTPPAGAGGGANPRPSWMTSEVYTPGEIGTDDIPTADWQEMLRAMGPDYVPTTVSGGDTQSRDVDPEHFDPYNFEGWSGLPGYDVGAIEGQTEDLISRILMNPESLDARTVARLKAAGREEQAAFGRMEQDELTGLGYDKGIEDSNFLASERLQSRRDRDAAISSSNRGIEIDAAKTNAGDRRAAATLGSAYIDSKGRLKLAQRAQEFGEQAEGERNKQASAASKQARAEYLTGVKSENANRALEASKVRMQADIANNDNLFKAATLRKDRVLGTVDADLKRVAATTDRYALREQVKQAATELGISQDKLLADWLKAQADDLTQRYGIDVAKEVDLRKLDQAGAEFKEDMAFRIMALEQEMRFKYAQLDESGRQFDYGYGLDAAALQQNADQFGVNSYFRSQGM